MIAESQPSAPPIAPPLTNPAHPGYGSSTHVAAYAFDPKIHPQPLPSFPTLDYLPGTSTSLNDTVIRDSDNHIYDATGQGNRKKLFDSTVYASRTGKLCGYRVPRAQAEISALVPEGVPEPNVTLSTDVHQKVMASAEHGYKKLDYEVLHKVEKPRINTGNMNKAYAFGWQRFVNPSILPRNRWSLPSDAPTGVADNDDVRVNDKRIRPVMVSTRNI